jgi:hypothetical protein
VFFSHKKLKKAISHPRGAKLLFHQHFQQKNELKRVFLGPKTEKNPNRLLEEYSFSKRRIKLWRGFLGQKSQIVGVFPPFSSKYISWSIVWYLQ